MSPRRVFFDDRLARQLTQIRQSVTRLLHSRRYFCDKLWAACSIRWNGDLEPCPCAYGDVPTFHIPTLRFLDAWNSEPYRKTRAWLLASMGRGRGNPPRLAPEEEVFDICRNCPVPLADRYSIVRWRLKGIGLSLRRRAWSAEAPDQRRMMRRKLDNYRRLLRFLRRPGDTVPAYPILGNIDVTNLCNLRCPLCKVGAREIDHPRGMMPVGDFARILEEVGPGLVVLELYRYGEPLLNPDIAEMVRIASEQYLIRTTISTSLSLPLSDQTIEGLVRGGLRTLVIAADGPDQATYETYRRGGRLELVLDNLRRIVAARETQGLRTPRIVWQYLVFAHNERAIGETRYLAKRCGADRFIAVEPSIPQYDAYSGWVSEKAGYRGLRDETRRRQVLDASIRPDRAPSPGSPFELVARIRNTTDETWSADSGERGTVRLGVKLYGPDGRFLHEMGRGILVRPAPPGEELVVTAPLHAPSEPGAYRLKLDMVCEGEYWYEWRTGHRSSPLWLDFTVV